MPDSRIAPHQRTMRQAPTHSLLKVEAPENTSRTSSAYSVKSTSSDAFSSASSAKRSRLPPPSGKLVLQQPSSPISARSASRLSDTSTDSGVGLEDTIDQDNLVLPNVEAREHLLGEGGCASVYAAEWLKPDGARKPVAIKILSDASAEGLEKELRTWLQATQNDKYGYVCK